MGQISHTWFRSLWQLPCLVIAAVNGVAAGGGLSMALAADIVYASPSAQFSCDFRSIGLTADLGALFLLPRLVGLRRSQELTLTGRRIGAQEAYELGIITSVVAADKLLAQATATARELQAAPASALAATKRLLQRRHLRSVAVRRLASLCKAFSCTNCLGVSPCVAWYLPPMAPRMAP